MSDIVVPGFKSSELIAELNKAFEGYSDEERAKLIKQVRKSCLFYYALIRHADKENMGYRLTVSSNSSSRRMARLRPSLSMSRRRVAFSVAPASRLTPSSLWLITTLSLWPKASSTVSFGKRKACVKRRVILIQHNACHS